MNLTFLTVLVSLLCNCVNAEKILVLSFFASKSHKITYMTLIEELASKGHEITVITPVRPVKEVKNIKEVFTFDVDAEVFSKFDPLKMKEANKNFNPLAILENFEQGCIKTYQLPQVKEVMSQQFDLIFMQSSINECALGIVHKMKAPLVLFFPVSAPDFITSKLGTRLPPSFVPHVMMDYSQDMSFFERFLNYGINMVYEFGSLLIYEPKMERIYREVYGDDSIPSIRTILGNASLLLSNGHFSVSGPKPYLPDIIDVGGIHSKSAKKLPEDLEKFVSKPGSKGFIYFSLGSIVKTESMREERRKMLLTVFSKFKDYQIVWKWNDEKMSDKPENVYLSKWLPQQDLLGHPNIKMFITHCGGGGLEESIYHGVPLLGLPLFGDQDMNARAARRLGFAHLMEWNTLDEEILTNGINEILNSSKYLENVKKLSTIFRDQPDDPLARGVYWIEYVMRHKGAPQLRSASRNLNYFQYHSYDIIGTYLSLICLVVYILYALIRFVFRKIRQLLFGTPKDIYSPKIERKKRN